MIVKVSNGHLWNLFDGADHVTYREIEKDEPMVVSEDLYDATLRYPKKDNEGTGPIKEIWLWIQLLKLLWR